MELENVIKLINAVSESSLTSFSMEDGDTKLSLMNEIESDYDGVVTDILVDNEQMVEYGQPMFVIKPVWQYVGIKGMGFWYRHYIYEIRLFNIRS